MPRGDGIGPGMGRGMGGGGGNRSGAGSGGNCFCPNCGERAPHQQGAPCYEVSCPKCGTKMRRE